MPAPSPIRHDADHARVLRLMVTDTYRWQHDWAAWRLRFHHDDLAAGITAAEVGAFIHSEVLKLCIQRAEAHAGILYLREEEDLISVFDRFGAIEHGPGHISALQSRDAVSLRRGPPCLDDAGPLIWCG